VARPGLGGTTEMKDASHYNKLKTLQAKHVGDICDSKKGNHVADENAKTRRQISSKAG